MYCVAYVHFVVTLKTYLLWNYVNRNRWKFLHTRGCLSLFTDHIIHTPTLHYSYRIVRADKYIFISCKYLLLSRDNQ